MGRLSLRPRGSDVALLAGHVATGQQLPEPPVDEQPLDQICELGANVGVGLAALAVRHPNARVLAVEAAPDNARLARANLGRVLGSRCTVVEAAVWDVDDLSLEIRGSSAGLLHPHAGEEAPVGKTRSITVERLLADHMPSGPIDYMHVDIVGCESRIISPGAGWLERVKALKVQLYDEHGLAPPEAEELLRGLGFRAWSGRTSYGDFVFGYRDEELGSK